MFIFNTPGFFNRHTEIFHKTWNNIHTFYEQNDIGDWLGKPPLVMMLYLLGYHSNQQYHFEFAKIRNSSSISKYATPQKFGVYEKPTLRIILVNNQNTFQKLDHQDHPAIEQGLTMSNKHQVKLYKIDEYTATLITNDHYWDVVKIIIPLLPKIFNITLLPDLKHILKLFGQGDYDKWLKAYEKYWEDQQIVLNHQKQQLNEIFNSQQKRILDNLEAELEDIRRAINDYMQSISKSHTRRNELNLRKIQLQNQKDFDTTELMEYIFKHPHIQSFQPEGRNKIKLNFFAPVQYYDLDGLHAYYKNTNNPIGRDNFIKWLFYKIFFQKEYTLWTETEVVINIPENRINGNTRTINDDIPHPHIAHLNCWGDNGPSIIETLSNGLYIEAIEQINGALLNINFYDTHAIEELCNSIKTSPQAQLKHEETGKWIIISDLKEEYNNETNQSDRNSQTETS